MNGPQIHGGWRSFSVSKAVEQIGDTLSNIRREDGLTWKEVGRIIGKSDDRASDYANALSEMTIGSFLLACREWNGRFANATFGMIGMKLVPTHGDESSDSEKLARILKLASLISSAIADELTPGVIDDAELEAISTESLDDAEHAIAALRARKTEQAKARLRVVGE